jgi:hypothetical protein
MEPDQDALGRIKNLENFMELNHYLAFRETEDYLWLKLRASGYEDPEAWATLIELGSKRRAEAWQIAKEMATSILSDQRGVERGNFDSVVEKLAEKLLVEQDLVPPTFTEWTECESCGRMPVPKRFEKTHSPNCPWCLPGGEI